MQNKERENGERKRGEAGEVIPVSAGSTVSAEEKLEGPRVDGRVGVIQQVGLGRTEVWSDILGAGSLHGWRLSDMRSRALPCSNLSFHCFNRHTQVNSPSWDMNLFSISVRAQQYNIAFLFHMNILRTMYF